ncbi:MAG: hypothetical protein ACJ0J6_04590, partial [Dehalococcoidia bacterium]
VIDYWLNDYDVARWSTYDTQLIQELYSAYLFRFPTVLLLWFELLFVFDANISRSKRFKICRACEGAIVYPAFACSKCEIETGKASTTVKGLIISFVIFLTLFGNYQLSGTIF